MIGKIKGTLAEIHGNEALIEATSGVSYYIFVAPSLISKKGQDIDVYTYLNVKEDELSLFGFATHEEFDLFRLLKSVDGVGPRTAFTVILSSNFTDIKTAIVSKDVLFFERIKGIGKKTAQKILLELSSKLGAEFELSDIEDTPDNKDALEALKALGFRAGDIRTVLRNLDSTLSLEEKIKAGLQKLTSR